MINTTNNNNSSENLPNSNKPTFIWLAVILVGVLALTAVLLQRHMSKNDADLNLSPSQVESLPQSERETVLNKQLEDLRRRQARLTSESTSSERYNIYIQLAEVYTALGNHEEAINSLNEIKDERQGNTRLWLTYATIYKNKGDLTESKKYLDLAMVIDDGNPDNWLFFISISDNLTDEEKKALYEEALTKTDYDQKIIEAFDTWKASQTQ